MREFVWYVVAFGFGAFALHAVDSWIIRGIKYAGTIQAHLFDEGTKFLLEFDTEDQVKFVPTQEAVLLKVEVIDSRENHRV